MATELQERYSNLLNNITAVLDIPPSKYKQAVDRYKAVGRWLLSGECGKELEGLSIYPQGSFMLGTVIRPYWEGKDRDYDIDLVCEFGVNRENINPDRIKKIVGARLSENATYARMMEKEGRRCWTINYAETDGIGFHIDILPSTGESQKIIQEILNSGVSRSLAETSIAITNKAKDDTYNWSTSNPKGFGQWFDTVKKQIFEKMVMAEKERLVKGFQEIFESIDEVPDQLVKTPLQTAIQILKHHRDRRFSNHQLECEKPISMIINTLAALLYKNESDVYSALNSIVQQLCLYETLLEFSPVQGQINLIIQRTKEGKWIIRNPVNPAENFADRWHEDNNARARAFFQWIKWVREDLLNVERFENMERLSKALLPIFGEDTLSKALFASQNQTQSSNSVTLKTPPTVLIEKNSPKPWKRDDDRDLFSISRSEK